MKKIELEGRILNYEVKRSRRKTLSIQVIDEDIIKVAAPSLVSIKTIEDIIGERAAWILQKAEGYKTVKNRLRIKNRVLLKGMEIEIKYVKKESNKITVSLQEQFFIVTSPRDLEYQEELKVLEGWYRKEARRILTEKTQYFCKKIGVEYNKIFIKDQKTVWGSCSSNNNLNYNYRIIMAPEKVIDYLVIHEVCHLVHRNHGEDYWNLVASIIPDYKGRRRYLKDNGMLLKL